jgi:hypothetical protein
MTEPHNDNQPSPPPAQPSPAQPSPAPPAPAPQGENRTAQTDLDTMRLKAELEMLRAEVAKVPERIARAIEAEHPAWATDPDLYASGVLFGMLRAAVIARRFSHT